MSSYIIKLDKAVHSTSDQCNTAITNAGATITTNYKMWGSYKVDATAEQIAANLLVRYNIDERTYLIINRVRGNSYL